MIMGRGELKIIIFWKDIPHKLYVYKKSQEQNALGFFSIGKWETPITRW